MSEPLPRVLETDFVERAGINHVASIVNDARCIWREILHRDIGIDGHIEYVDPDGLAPGRLIAVQVKSGASYFAGFDGRHLRFTPKRKHRTYWTNYPIPVMLILHNPEAGETYWCEVGDSIRSSHDDEAITLDRLQKFDADGVLDALATAGPLPVGGFDIPAVLREMAEPDPSAQGVCFLYMFAQGMTDVTRTVYVSTEVLGQVLDVISASWPVPSWGFGEAEHIFLDRYVDFLIAHDLARVDYRAWREPALERGMTGRIFAPLTTNGEIVKSALIAIDESLPMPADEPHPEHCVAIRERFVQMMFNTGIADEPAARQRRIESVRRTILAAPEASQERPG